MECNVYNQDLERIAIIDSFISLVWDEYYNTLGSFQLEVWRTEDNQSLFQLDFYIGHKKSKTLMIVKSIQVTADKILVSGYTATKILDDRISTQVISNQNAEQALRSLVGSMNPWKKLELGTLANIPDKFLAQKSDASILEYCENIAQSVDMGFFLEYNKQSKKILFVCYKPEENTNVRFSTSFGNMLNLEYSLSSANFKNVAVVAGQGTGKQRITILAGDTTAEENDRREMYIDARNEQQEESESLEDYKKRLIAVGESRLVEQFKIQNIKFTLDDDRAKLGDIVLCMIPELDIKLRIRIVGIESTYQNNIEKHDAVLGNPIQILKG